MGTRRNIEYELTPTTLNFGEKWVTLKLKNKRERSLRNLHIRLNSLDTLGLEIKHGSEFIPIFAPGEEIVLNFRIATYLTTPVYVSMDGYEAETSYYWETPAILIRLIEDVAELKSLFAQRKEHILTGDTIKCEATITAHLLSEDIHIEIWLEDPEMIIEEIETEQLGRIEASEVKVHKTSFSPEKEGIYTVHAELFEGIRRIGHKVDYVIVENA